MSSIRWLRAARQELLDVVRWYEAQSRGLGGAFLDELEPVIEHIRNAATNFPQWEFRIERLDVRRANLKRFPHRVMFILHGDEVWITAIQHPSRSPRYWVRRLGQIPPEMDQSESRPE